MKREEKIMTYNKNIFIKIAAKLSQALMLLIAIVLTSQSLNAQVDCSSMPCDSTDQQTIVGEQMFNEHNFAAIVDDLGRTRKFWIHIPASYDTLPANKKMPVIFAFHGANQYREAMVLGKWDEYFDQNTAFVIPLGEKGLCDTNNQQQTTWIYPSWGPGVPFGTPLPSTCDPMTQRLDDQGDPVTYFDSSLSDTFTDVRFIQQLRTTILNSFPKLNASKFFGNGFSKGGNFANTLLCYRSSLFRGISVAADSLYKSQTRGDYNDNGIDEIHPNSLIATCGKSQWQNGHATGINSPDIWGIGITGISNGNPVYQRVTRPVIFFHGDRDDNYTQQEINQTTNEIRSRNNLTSFAETINNYQNIQNDNAKTTRKTFQTASNSSQNSSALRRYSVIKTAGPLLSAGHAMPDAEECPTNNLERMTCDYSSTTETMNFFVNYAGLNLNP